MHSSSRPIRPDLFYVDAEEFLKAHNELIKGFHKIPSEWSTEEIARANKVIYTGVTAFACCYDLWQRGSRKTPGTFFEVFVAGILKELFADYYFSKHIPLVSLLENIELEKLIKTENPLELSNKENNENELEGGEEDASSLSTDLVIKSANSERSLVIPLKITTRERIVQPFAHQRILNSAFGPNIFTSYLVCISETQQDSKKRKVNQVCVPGPVKLFQKHLAPLGGLYYCDIPQRYNASDIKRVIPIKTAGDFLVDAYLFFKLEQ